MPVIIDEHTQYSDTGGKPLVNGSVFIGVANLDPIANPEPIFSDPELQNSLANPQPLNDRGQTLNKIYAAGEYSFQLNNSADVQVELDLLRGAIATAGGTIFLFNVTGINDLVAEADPPISEWIDKQQYALTIVNENTGSMTVDGGPGSRELVNAGGSAIAAGQFTAGIIINFNYNGATDRHELISSESTIPAGFMMESAGAGLVDGWLLCDGSAYNSVSDTSLTNLFNAISTTYGGTGASSFNVPDRRGRVGIGLDNMGGTSAGRMTNASADVVGGTGGLEKVALVAANNGQHDHPYTIGVVSGTGGGNEGGVKSLDETTTDSSGLGTPHENTQPWMAFNIYIKK